MPWAESCLRLEKRSPEQIDFVRTMNNETYVNLGKSAVPPTDIDLGGPRRAADGGAHDAGFGLLDFIGLARRRRELIVAVTVFGTGVATVFGYSRVPLYTSEIQILIEPEHR